MPLQIVVEEIGVDKLVQLWIGEGLVQSKQPTHLMSMAIELQLLNLEQPMTYNKWVFYRLLTLLYPHPYTLNTSISSHGKKTAAEHCKTCHGAIA